MRLVRTLLPAAVIAVWGMATLGVSSAVAEPDQITICKKLVTGKELCPLGQLAPKDTKILLLAKESKLVTSSGTATCEDSIMTILTLEEVNAPLPVDVSIEFGKLPTPKLGEGCSVCTGGIHTGETRGAFNVKGTDEFSLLMLTSAEYLNCFGFLTCQYGTAGFELDFPIDRDATIHPALSGAKGDLILINEVELVRTGGSGLCPASEKWIASYTGIGCDLPTGTVVDCWIALDNKA